MAKNSGGGKTRLPIKTQTMRELMFRSGGRCAMTDCGLPLTSPTGGWIGTVAHIVGAERDAPRGDSPMTAEERAAIGNLILMCATHGREVDAPDTGEANFPLERLRAMKEKHEAKVTEAVTAAIEQDRACVQTATGAIDTGLRPARAAATAEGLLESLCLEDKEDIARFVDALNGARASLQRLSQVAIDTLSQLLHLWLLDCRDELHRTCDFGDPSDGGPFLPVQNVKNRVIDSRLFNMGLDELQERNIVEVSVDDDAGTADYAFRPVWSLSGRDHYNFWITAAHFLYEAYGLEIQDWIAGLDFSIFDRIAPKSSRVDWR
ncbi:hypothetical protein AB0H71_25260 [Nocardia sp. NPDC050697]|uniref:hypothetical protein n=1 Tax=Nocardia sp. NPDC050697 TaxID=3155158 RepID=UPI0033FA1B39